MFPLVPLQSTGLLLFRLFGLLFAVLGVLNLVRPREMTAYAVRRRAGGAVTGRVEPTRVRILFTRLIGAVMIVLGVALAAGALGP